MTIREVFSIPDTGNEDEMTRSAQDTLLLYYDGSDPRAMSRAPLQVWGERNGRRLRI